MARLVNCTFKFLIYADEKKMFFILLISSHYLTCGKLFVDGQILKKKCCFFEVYHAALTIYETCDFDLNVIECDKLFFLSYKFVYFACC